MMTKGKLVHFRPIEEGDIDDGWLDWINDQDLFEGLITRGPQSRDELVEYYNKSKWPNASMFAICINETNEYIGNARLAEFNWIHRYCTYGRLLSTKAHKKGYGSEALFLLFRYGFYVLGINRIASAAAVFNKASLRSNEKFGMKREGIQRQRVYWDGDYHDAIALSMLRQDFDELYPDGSLDAYWDRQNAMRGET